MHSHYTCIMHFDFPKTNGNTIVIASVSKYTRDFLSLAQISYEYADIEQLSITSGSNSFIYWWFFVVELLFIVFVFNCKKRKTVVIWYGCVSAIDCNILIILISICQKCMMSKIEKSLVSTKNYVTFNFIWIQQKK